MNSFDELTEENKRLKKELESYQLNEKLFQALVETAVGDIGEEFFNNIVIKLSEWLNAECVIIGQIIRENVAEAFPMYLDGQLINGFTYELSDTPCDLTSKKGYCIFPSNVRELYPKAKDLINLNAQGYVGIALYNKNGEATGVLCAISRNPLRLLPQSESLLRIVGARVSSEIERIKTWNALEISESKLKNALSTRDRLFSLISHDLKTPFNALMGFSSLLKDRIREMSPEKTEKYISLIHDVSHQTYNLLINLLDWSLTQSDDIKFSPGNYTVRDLLDLSVKSQRNIAKHKEISITYSIENNTTIFVDSNMFAAILRNLISNAIKFTPRGGKITLNVFNHPDKTTFCITDTGTGLTQEHIDNLFNSNQSFSSSGTETEKGAGLGLLICRDFVRKHEGEIWVKSTFGKGSEFYFTIPKRNSD